MFRHVRRQKAWYALRLSSQSGGTYPAKGSTFTIVLTDVHFPSGSAEPDFEVSGAITGKLP
jgi:hypothetical protein